MGKLNVAVATDSTANIPDDYIHELNIYVIPQVLNWEGDTFLDGIDITPSEFYQRLVQAKELPTTSQPSAGQFYEFFGNLAEKHEAIIGVFISEHLSGTIDSALTGAEMMSDFPIEIVDSKSASMGLGFMVMAVARALKDGASYEEAAQLARDLIPVTHAIFVVDTLEYLHKGGRIGGAQRLVGSLLSMKPLLHLEEGRIEPLARIRTKRKAVEKLLDVVASDTEGKGKLHASVIHAAAPEDAEQFKEQVLERLDPVEIISSELSPVVGTHTGPGLVGMGYYTELP
ncbi:MAG: DegV family protein [Chloroflexota bacterium]|jgi:DegV family protein with EDD domain